MAAVDPDQYETLHNRFISARQKAAIADHHAKRIAQLEDELVSEEGKHAELVETLATEERDVEKLEKFSFHKLKAKLGEGLDVTREREMLEAQAAADAVVESSEHVAGLRSEFKRLTTELAEIEGAAETAEAARFELETYVRRTFPDVADELGTIDNNIAALRADIVEVEEAIAAGDFAVLEMNELIKTLKRATNTSTLDLFADGMIGVTIEQANEYSKLRERFISARQRATREVHHKSRLEELSHELEVEGARKVELEGVLASEQLDVDELEKLSQRFNKFMWNRLRNEVIESFIAADFALLELDDLVDQLQAAKKWSSADLYWGGMFVSIAKRDRVSVSTEQSRKVSLALEILDKELGDTSLQAMDSQLTGALENAIGDVFFDSFFVNLHVDGKIRGAFAEAEQVRSNVKEIRRKLHELVIRADDRILAIEEQRSHILVS